MFEGETHLTRGGHGGKAFLASLFSLFALLEESLRDFDVLFRPSRLCHCQTPYRISTSVIRRTATDGTLKEDVSVDPARTQEYVRG